MNAPSRMAGPTTATAGEMPLALKWARWLLIAVSAGHLLAVAVVVAVRGTLRGDILADNPQYMPSELSRMVLLEMVRTSSFHLLLVVVCAVYAAKLPAGRPRVVRVIVASQVLSLVFGAFTVATAPSVLVPILPPFMLAAAVILALLFVPTSRAYLSYRRRAHTGSVEIH